MLAFKMLLKSQLVSTNKLTSALLTSSSDNKFYRGVWGGQTVVFKLKRVDHTLSNPYNV